MRIAFLGGMALEAGGQPVAVSGAMQRAALFRLALDAGAVVSYRDLADDLWPDDPPENERAALQSIVSRLRTQLPAEAIGSEPGGYRLRARRADVDILRFQDLVAAARSDPVAAPRLATEALALWTGEPWLPGEQFGWLREDLLADRQTALDCGGVFELEEDPRAIPAPLTPLIGRQAELDGIAAQLAANRLVTIVGTGGAGKTRLALEAAGRLAHSVAVELAPVGGGDIWQAILGALGRDIRQAESSPEPRGARERVTDALAGREAVLVLDNCEHVVEAAAAVAAELLRSLPRLRILTTSREPLGLLGEAFVTLGPLAHPAPEEIGGLAAEPWQDFPALELLRQRVRSARGRDLSETELADAARITARLDGLPLAIELAAAKARTMTIAEVAEGLDDRFALLGRGLRGTVARHQTLRALIDWSWSLLDAAERRALCWMAVFPAGVAAAAAAEVAERFGCPAGVFDSLVDKSLLYRSEGRYRALETIREYGIERLAEEGRTRDAQLSLAGFVADAAEAHDLLLRGPGILDAVAWFDDEEDNAAAALRFAVDDSQGVLACRITAANLWYWVIRNRFSDVGPWVKAVVSLAEGVDSEAAAIIRLIGRFIVFGEQNMTVEPSGEQISALIEALSEDLIEPRPGMGDLAQVAPLMVAALASAGGNPSQVVVPRGEELSLDPWPCAILHVMRAAMAQNLGETDELGEASQTAVRLFAENGDRWGLALAKQMLSEWLVLQGRLEEALTVSAESTEGLRRITSSWDLAQQQGLAVTILARLGRLDEAKARTDALLQEAEEGGWRAQIQAGLIAANLAVVTGDAADADAHLACVDELSAQLPNIHDQLVALRELLRADIAVLRHEHAPAETALRAAADAAIASHDHPIIAQVALGLGTLAVDRGDRAEARRALELAVAIKGADDATDLKVRAIRSAIGEDGAGRSRALPPGRSDAIRELDQIFRR